MYNGGTMIKFTEVHFIKNDYSLIAQTLKNETVVFLGSEIALSKLMPNLEKHLISISYTTKVYGKECTHENAQVFKQDQDILNASIIVGVGGGKALDQAKYIAKDLNKKFYTIPTIASTCAATSSVSVIYDNQHHYVGVMQYDTPADICFIPLEIIAEAPYKYLWAGIGDTIAKPIEMDMTLRHREQSVNMQLARSLTPLCLSECLNYAEDALLSVKRQKISLALEHVSYAIIANTGFASSLMHLRYGTNLAHSIHNALVSYPAIHDNHIHGEIVAYGLLVLLQMDNNEKVHQELTDFYKRINLPTKLKDLDMPNDDKTIEEIVKATLEDEFLVESCYPITFDMVKDAFIKQETYD